MRKWLIGAALGTLVLGACETSSPQPPTAATSTTPAVATTAAATLEGVAVDAAIRGLPGAVWSDPNNTGYVTGYTYQGQYHAGPPPGYDPMTHSVVDK